MEDYEPPYSEKSPPPPEPSRKPDILFIKEATLKDSPRRLKVVKYAAIKDRHTGNFHHDAITIRTFKKAKGGLEMDEAHSVNLDSQAEDEISILLDFIARARGEVPTHQTAPDALPFEEWSNSAKVDAFADILKNSSSNPELLEALVAKVAAEPLLFVETLLTFAEGIKRNLTIVSQD